MLLKKTIITILLLSNSLAVFASTINSDHPLIERFPGTEINENDSFESDFEQFKFATEAVVDEELKNVITVEGKLTHILYEPTEEEISLRKVYRNYESVLNRNDFEVLFSCEKEDCGAYLLNQMFSKSHLWKFFSSADFNGDPYAKFYYISARKELEGKLTYISYILYEYGPTYIIQDVLEVESVDDTLLEMNLNFDDMSKQGRVVLGGLFFDSGKATLLNESAESLELIANYVKDSKNKKFFVVGHTDSDGSHQLNLDLSLKRATAVVNELVTTFAVDKTQVLAIGNGATSPINSNQSSAGKAKNRRVELVER